jgi:hypothetical protein
MIPEFQQRDLQGDILKRRAMAEFILTENLYQPGFKISKHYHDNAILGSVLRGSYTNTYHQVTINIPRLWR